MSSTTWSAQPWAPHYLRIAPNLSWSFNLEGAPFGHDREVRVQRTVHQPPAGP